MALGDLLGKRVQPRWLMIGHDSSMVRTLLFKVLLYWTNCPLCYTLNSHTSKLIVVLTNLLKSTQDSTFHLLSNSFRYPYLLIIYQQSLPFRKIVSYILPRALGTEPLSPQTHSISSAAYTTSRNILVTLT